ncbi:putative branched-subunit amino acid permease [Robbsia andropogonis]|uniref:AzlC family ABC transporter permease n=1 Tax=Robbsia andropogonis TaxID=28092 RepID=UPI003D235F9D
MTDDNHLRRASLIKGCSSMLPFTVTAFTNGVLGGVLAIAAGMSPAASLFMAMALNSGSAQFVVTKMLQEGAPFFTIAFAVLIVSLRMLIYATEMRSYVKGAPLRWRVWLGFGLIDAIFFTVKDLYGNKRNHGKFDVLWFCMGSSLTMLSIWMVATALGVGLGKMLNEYIVFGLDFPILAMFATMLIGAVSRFRHVVAVSLAGVSAIYFRDLPYNAGLMVSAFIGASAGVAFQYFQTSRVATDA